MATATNLFDLNMGAEDVNEPAGQLSMHESQEMAATLVDRFMVDAPERLRSRMIDAAMAASKLVSVINDKGGLIRDADTGELVLACDPRWTALCDAALAAADMLDRLGSTEELAVYEGSVTPHLAR